MYRDVGVGRDNALQLTPGAVHLSSTPDLEELQTAISYTSPERLIQHLPFHEEVKAGFARVYG